MTKHYARAHVALDEANNLTAILITILEREKASSGRSAGVPGNFPDTDRKSSRAERRIRSRAGARTFALIGRTRARARMRTFGKVR